MKLHALDGRRGEASLSAVNDERKVRCSPPDAASDPWMAGRQAGSLGKHEGGGGHHRRRRIRTHGARA